MTGTEVCVCKCMKHHACLFMNYVCTPAKKSEYVFKSIKTNKIQQESKNLSPCSLSRYTYGKPVVGAADIRLRIVESNRPVVSFPPIPLAWVSFYKDTW